MATTTSDPDTLTLSFGDNNDQSLPMSLYGMDAQLVPSDSSTQQQIFTTTASITAWNRHLNKLDDDNRLRFVKFSQGSVEEFSNYVVTTAKKHKESSHILRVNEFLKPFVRTMGRVLPAVSSASQAHPNPSCIVVGGVMCLLQMSEHLTDYQAQLAECLDTMTEQIGVLVKYEELIYRHDGEIQDVLVEVYGDILDFLQRALGLLEDEKRRRRSGLRITLKSLKEEFRHTFADVLGRFQTHLKQYEELAKFRETQKLLQSYRLQATTLARLNESHFEANTHFQEINGNFQEARRELQNTQILQSQTNVSVNRVAGQMTELQETVDANEARQRAEIERIRAKEEKERARREILEWIPHVEFNDEHTRRCEVREEGTANWLVDDEIYQHWLADTKSSVLWVTGNSSCGKSILAATTWDLLNAQDYGTDTALARFYCDSGDPERRSPSVMWTSIFKEVCAQMKELYPELKKLYEKKKDMEKKGPSLTEVRTQLKTAMNSFYNVIVLIDGLDECDDPGAFLKDLNRLVESASFTLKAIIFSRPEYVAIKDSLKHAAQVKVDKGANTPDIRSYLSSTLAEPDFGFRNDVLLLEEIKQVLVNKAEGSFLYVSLQTEYLKGPMDRDELMERLYSLPEGLTETYTIRLKKVLENKNSRLKELALNILVWITNSYVPLSRKELLEALATKPGISSAEELRKRLLGSDEQFATICADLIEIDQDGIYRLIHGSLRDYFYSLAKECPTELLPYRDKQVNAHQTLAETCLRYLSFDEFEKGPVDSKDALVDFKDRNALLKYAACWWGKHVRDSSQEFFADSVWAVLDNDGIRNLSMQILQAQLDHVDGKTDREVSAASWTTPLHLLSWFDLKAIADLRKFDIEAKTKSDTSEYSPLDRTLLGKSHDMCMWLLDNEEDKDHLFTDGPQYSALHVTVAIDWKDAFEKLLLCEIHLDRRTPVKKETVLMTAANRGRIWAVEKLLALGVDIEACNSNDSTALAYAAEGGQDDIIDALLKQNAKVNVHDKDGITPLHLAVANCKTNGVELLLAYGADVSVAATEAFDFQTPMHVAAAESSISKHVELLHSKSASLNSKAKDGIQPMHYAAFRDSLEVAKLLKSLGASTDARTDDGKTVLHIAAEYSSDKFVEFLLQSDPESVHSRTNEVNQTALHRAAVNGNIPVCRVLLDSGADIDAVDSKNQSALILAVSNGELETFQFLLSKKANPFLKGIFECPALHYAAHDENSDFILPLMKAGCLPNVRNEHGQTALHFAARKGHNTFIRKLIEACAELGHSLDFSDEESSITSLHIAAEKGLTETVQLLLENGMKEKVDTSNNLPIHLAVWGGHADIVQMLLSPDNINVRGCFGRTPLFCAAAAGQKTVLELLLKERADTEIRDEDGNTALIIAISMRRFEIANILIDHNANVHAKGWYECTPIYEAARSGNEQLLSRLLQTGCNKFARTQLGISVFAGAAGSGNPNMVQLLLSEGIDGVSDIDERGWTTLHHAAEEGKLELAQTLIAHGVDVNAVSRRGLSALCSAVAPGNIDMVRFLLQSGAKADQEYGNVFESALAIAAFGTGSVEIVTQLLNAGAEKNRPLTQSNMSPLNLAAAACRMDIVGKLLEADANLFQLDVFGKTAFDYLVVNGVSELPAIHPVKRSERELTIHRSIVVCVDAILSIEDLSTYAGQYSRIIYLEVLAPMLMYLDESLALEHSWAPFCELLFQKSPFFNSAATCAFCSVNTEWDCAFTCTKCFDVYLCETCHDDYVDEKDLGKDSAPKAFRELYDLENSLMPIKKHLVPQLKSQARLVIYSVMTFNFVIEWIDSKYEEYALWEGTHGQRFRRRERPGWGLLKLLRSETLRPILEETDEDKLESAWKEQVNEYLRIYGGDKWSRPFCCKGHTYIKIAKKDYEEARNDPELFDTAGRLTNDWLRNLRLKHESLAIEMTIASALLERSPCRGMEEVTLPIRVSAAGARNEAKKTTLSTLRNNSVEDSFLDNEHNLPSRAPTLPTEAPAVEEFSRIKTPQPERNDDIITDLLNHDRARLVRRATQPLTSSSKPRQFTIPLRSLTESDVSSSPDVSLTSAKRISDLVGAGPGEPAVYELQMSEEPEELDDATDSDTDEFANVQGFACTSSYGEVVLEALKLGKLIDPATNNMVVRHIMRGDLPDCGVKAIIAE